MEGIINSLGYLYIRRAGTNKAQVCPFFTDIPSEPQQYCGDWCPLFEEPEFERTAEYNTRTKENTVLIDSGSTTLKLCKAFLKFTSFVDERIHLTPENTKPAAVELPKKRMGRPPKAAPHPDRPISNLPEGFKVLDLPKKRRGRPPKASPTDAQVIDLVTTLHPLPMPEEPDQAIYHEACKTCRKSSMDNAGTFPRCSMATFSTGSSGIETCEFWWEREGSRC